MPLLMASPSFRAPSNRRGGLRSAPAPSAASRAMDDAADGSPRPMPDGRAGAEVRRAGRDRPMRPTGGPAPGSPGRQSRSRSAWEGPPRRLPAHAQRRRPRGASTFSARNEAHEIGRRRGEGRHPARVGEDEVCAGDARGVGRRRIRRLASFPKSPVLMPVDRRGFSLCGGASPTAAATLHTLRATIPAWERRWQESPRFRGTALEVRARDSAPAASAMPPPPARRECAQGERLSAARRSKRAIQSKRA